MVVTVYLDKIYICEWFPHNMVAGAMWGRRAIRKERQSWGERWQSA